MNSADDKYEYLLHTWGGFYNEEHKLIHGKESGYFFFDTKAELNAYVNELREIEIRLNATVLMGTVKEGRRVRYKTIAKMNFKHAGKVYPYTEDFGYAYPPESARFMFEDGNYACDCNRAMFINEQYNTNIPEECGEAIEMTDFEIELIKK